MPVSFIVSALQIRGEEITVKVIGALQTFSVPAKSLTIEITESVAVDNPDQAMQVFQRLKDYGVTISIDDFGTGYSSLSYLRDFPACELKIDRAFVKGIVVKQEARELLKAIIVMGHALRMTVVAEGVQDAATAEILELLGCDVLQGYYFSEPKIADDIEALLDGSQGVTRRGNHRPRPDKPSPGSRPPG